MTNYFDLEWKKSDYYYYENMVPKLKDNAPKWVVDSYNHYMEQLKERYCNKNRLIINKSGLNLNKNYV